MSLTPSQTKQIKKGLHNSIALIGIKLGLNSKDTLKLARSVIKDMSWQSIAGVKATLVKGRSVYAI